MPITIGVFIDPSVFPTDDGSKPRSNRSVEYDTLSDDYSRFLLDEILPEVGKTYNLADDRMSRSNSNGILL
jgi:enterochelin esterase-like enzyme